MNIFGKSSLFKKFHPGFSWPSNFNVKNPKEKLLAGTQKLTRIQFNSILGFRRAKKAQKD
jgi:hypothetical protein